MKVKKKKTAGKTGGKITPASYRERSYRNIIDPDGMVSTLVTVRETDLHILAPVDVFESASQSVYRFRNQLENYINSHPGFLKAMRPLPMDLLAPPMIREMLQAAITANVGPMAAVAGVIAEYVGRELLVAGSGEVMVENGGDIFLARNKDCIASIFAGQSPLSGRVGIRVPRPMMPVGLCTSSGTVGHSLSLGRADSVTVLAGSTALADAVATRLGNEVTGGEAGRQFDQALAVARQIPGIHGVVIILDQQLGAWGQVDLVALD